MNIPDIHKKFNTRNRCILYLETLKWNKKPVCPFCDSEKVYKRMLSIKYHCNSCNKDFTVLHDTIFEESKLPLSKWFVIIGLMLNAKQGISAKEIQRNVGTTYKTAWYSAMRVRCAMIDHCNIELENVVEMDETYVGGKPRYKYSKKDNEPNLSKLTSKRGRGTSKVPVVGIVERKNKIVLKVVDRLTSKNLVGMLKEFVNTDTSIVVTDEFKSYKAFDEIVQHYTVNHSKKEYVKGMMHTNTIEGFWSIVKNSIKGNYKAISKKYLPFYLVQAQYNYNHRNYSANLFEKFLKQALETDKPMIGYKPVKNVNKIVYKTCKK
ncbi:MAG TPA: IS1595 family transposase [Bacteroidales bacterium]|nr:IS1595 family transposase [Bacteroidales bacterium]